MSVFSIVYNPHTIGKLGLRVARIEPLCLKSSEKGGEQSGTLVLEPWGYPMKPPVGLGLSLYFWLFNSSLSFSLTNPNQYLHIAYYNHSLTYLVVEQFFISLVGAWPFGSDSVSLYMRETRGERLRTVPCSVLSGNARVHLFSVFSAPLHQTPILPWECVSGLWKWMVSICSGLPSSCLLLGSTAAIIQHQVCLLPGARQW